jgi:hypothetical protein
VNFPQLALKYPQFLAWNESEGVLEMYLDHHSMSHMRMCESMFIEEITNCIHGRGVRYWSLEFGVWVHDCLERFYDAFKKTGQPPELDPWVNYCLELWDLYDLDYYKPDPLKLVKNYRTDEKKYHSFGGREGAAGFLIHYYGFYINQRLRVVGTEIAFGRSKEVLLGSFRFPRYKWWEGPEGEDDLVVESWDKVNVYLTGRIDLLGDNTYKIGPVDHKSTARFDGYESNDYDPHEGITGYIYAINEILKKRFPDNPHKICRDGWIYHISVNALEETRFKATLITKTPQQLLDYAARQLRTARRILDVLTGQTPDMNTLVCNNIYNKPCPYRELHRQPTEQRLATIQQFYEIREAWNPEKPPSLQRKKEAATSQQEDTTKDLKGQKDLAPST